MTKRRRLEQKTLKQTKMRMVLLLLQSKDVLALTKIFSEGRSSKESLENPMH